VQHGSEYPHRRSCDELPIVALRAVCGLQHHGRIGRPATADSSQLGSASGTGTAVLDPPHRSPTIDRSLFWLHGDESPSRLETYLEKVAEGGNGSFTAESRPHTDWLGAGWYRDLGVCLEAAKKHDLKMWIFDEQWWPSGEVGGKVPERYASKYIVAAATEVDGPRSVAQKVSTDRLIAVLAGKSTPQGTVDGNSLVDLTPQAAGGNRRWEAPAGGWRVRRFTW